MTEDDLVSQISNTFHDLVTSDDDDIEQLMEDFWVDSGQPLSVAGEDGEVPDEESEGREAQDFTKYMRWQREIIRRSLLKLSAEILDDVMLIETQIRKGE